MCLCMVEPGPPKPQAACTLTAQDGMVVRTSLTSKLAAEAQNATLEFILVNHPLDCPVCDKGGECPLQDLTFRYGPGNTRMTFPKRTFDKPIPISPPLSQTGQSSGWLTRMNSSVAFCASAAISDVSDVRTTIPSCAVSVQAACGFGGPGSTMQRHMRQAPTGGPRRGS